ncbi:uncharacterized protein LOC144598963 isoform X2 [Rhinoraja longicauda]
MKKEESMQLKMKTDCLTSLKLFKVLGLVYHLHFLVPVTCVLHPPRNLSFVSENFHHTLMWEAGPDTPLNTRYIVEYLSFSAPEQLVAAENCVLIVNRTCDLTDDFSDIYGNYWPQVKAVGEMDESNWTTMDSPFQPHEQTHIRPINVQLAESPVGVLNVSFDIAAPTVLISRNLNVKSLIDIYMKLQYHIGVYKDGKLDKNRELLTITSKTSINEIFESVEPNSKYCITINIFYLKEKNTDPLEMKCIVTQFVNEDKGTEAPTALLVSSVCIIAAVLIIVVILYKTGVLAFFSMYVPQSLKNFKYTHATHNYNDVQGKFNIIDRVCVSEVKVQPIDEESEDELIDNGKETAYERNFLPITMQDSAQSSSLVSDNRTDGTCVVACNGQQFDSFTNFSECEMLPTDAIQNERTDTEIMSQLKIDLSRKSSLPSASVNPSDVPLCSVQIQGPDCSFVDFSNVQTCDQDTCESNIGETNDLSDSLTSDVYVNTAFYQSAKPVQCDIPSCPSFPQALHSHYMRR